MKHYREREDEEMATIIAIVFIAFVLVIIINAMI